MNYLQKILTLNWPYVADNSDNLQLIDFLDVTKGLRYALFLRERLSGQQPLALVEKDLIEGKIIEINDQYILTENNSELYIGLRDDELYEVATIAAIMGDHVTDDLYKLVQERNSGYISTVEMIGHWAVEFYKKFESVTEWADEVINNPEHWDLSENVCCWDDCVIEFAMAKCEDYRLS